MGKFMYNSRFKRNRWRKHLLVPTLTVTLLASGINNAYAQNANEFVDVSKSSDFYEYIHDLANEGIMEGYENGLYFKPNNLLTRGQMVKMFVNIIEKNNVKLAVRDGKEFTDTENTTYTEYASKAYSYNIVDGYGSEFKPNNNATRGQIAKLIVETFGFEKQGTYNPYKDTLNTTFSDYVQILYEQGITDAPNGLYKPNDKITRGQFSKLLSIALEKWKETNNDNSNVTEDGNATDSENTNDSTFETASANISLRNSDGFLNGYVTLTPKNSNGFTQEQLDEIKNIKFVGGVSYSFPSLPTGEYTVTVTNLKGGYLGEIIQGKTLTVKKGTENNFDIVVDSSNNSNIQVSDVTLNWRFVDDSGNPIEDIVFQITPSNTEGLDTLLLSKMRNVRTDSNGEISIALPNDRDYTLKALSLTDSNKDKYEGFTESLITQSQLQSEKDGIYDNTITLKAIKEVNPIDNIDELRSEFLRLLNEERNAHGLSSVQYNSVLNEVAKERSQHMVDNDYFSHAFNGITQAPYLLKQRGYTQNEVYDIMENIAFISNPKSGAEELFEAWKNSPGHYTAFMMDKNYFEENYLYIGLDVAKYSNGSWTATYIISTTNYQ